MALHKEGNSNSHPTMTDYEMEPFFQKRLQKSFGLFFIVLLIFPHLCKIIANKFKMKYSLAVKCLFFEK